MRAREFITETTGSIQPEVEHTLPAAWVIDKLQNNDFYMQYRFGVAIAGAKGAEQRKQDNVPEFRKETPWGENEVIVSYAGKDPLQGYIDDAMRQMGLKPSDARLVTTEKSEEPIDTKTVSTLKPFKGYKRK
jgi:hypothetical protein